MSSQAALQHRPARPAPIGPSQPMAARPAPALMAMAAGLDRAPRVRQLAAMAPPAGRSGLPDPLRAGIENLSGVSMEGVAVHYNSPRPAQLHAAAYAQGRDIHLAPGQAHHLPHEAWHVVQQAQGRVKATAQLKNGVPLNDDGALEREADAMGARAAGQVPGLSAAPAQRKPRGGVVQRQLDAVFGGAYGPAIDNKMAAVVATLNRMGLGVAQTVEVVIGINRDPDHLHTNPADTELTHHPTYESIRINIESWFVEMSSVGEILGMINHEIGVHSLANLELTPQQKAQESIRSGQRYSRNIAGAPRRLAPLAPRGSRAARADRRQRDHVNVAKFSTAPLQPMPRMERYIQTMLRMGDAIQATPFGPHFADAAAKLTAQDDMFQTFLFDMGRIIATDDGATWAVAIGAGDIAAVFNWLHTYLVNRYAGGHAWLNHVVVRPATASSLIGMLTTKVAKALWGQRGAIGNIAYNAAASTINTVASTVTAPVRWLGSWF